MPSEAEGRSDNYFTSGSTTRCLGCPATCFGTRMLRAVPLGATADKASTSGILAIHDVPLAARRCRKGRCDWV